MPTANQFPERLLIFHSPTPVTALTGMNKAMTIVLFGVGGCMVAGPNVYFNPDMPLWMTPAGTMCSSWLLFLPSSY